VRTLQSRGTPRSLTVAGSKPSITRSHAQLAGARPCRPRRLSRVRHDPRPARRRCRCDACALAQGAPAGSQQRAHACAADRDDGGGAGSRPGTDRTGAIEPSQARSMSRRRRSRRLTAALILARLARYGRTYTYACAVCVLAAPAPSSGSGPTSQEPTTHPAGADRSNNHNSPSISLDLIETDVLRMNDHANHTVQRPLPVPDCDGYIVHD